MKTWIILPAFNEEKNILEVIRQIKHKKLPIIVVDDGSTDSTYSKVEGEKVEVLLKNKQNLGKGASIRVAFRYIIDNKLDCDAAIIMDSDAQHLPQELDSFIKKLKEGSFFVLGNRLSNPKDMPWLRIITNKCMSFLLSRMVKQKVPDTQCGFKGLRKELLEKLSLTTSKYEIDSEFIIKVASLGYRIDSIPIKSIYRKQRSDINPFLDSCRFIRYILKVR
ncbi:MAG: glycosyltransferase family 2 protein [Candidatus Omnitrophica bacterium]|nr:glycosyltransferase family 2 protein [Candidatus Omnitrophota bacterium]